MEPDSELMDARAPVPAEAKPEAKPGAADRVAGLSAEKRELLDALLRKKRAHAGAAAAFPSRKAGPLPLSFSQERLWVIDQLEPGTPAYNMPLALRLTGTVEPALLARIFTEIVRRHEALRTTFAVHDGQPVQVIAGELRVPLPLVDLSVLPAAERESQALQLAREEAARPFDLGRGPLLRLGLIRLSRREHLLLITLHHIISDGWSLGILQREIVALHAAFSAGRPSPLPELPLQYADFAVWQRSRLQGEVLATQLDGWRRELADAPGELALPTDRPRAPWQSREGASLPATLPGGLTEAVRELARQTDATPFMLLLAAFQMLLHRWSGQDDVLVGTPVASRRRLETEGLIGFFVNTLVLRGRLAVPGLTFRSFVEQTRDTALAAFERQDLPFERLVEELVPERNLAVSPLFQVFFSLQTASAGRLSIPGLTLESLPVRSGKVQFDLSLDLLDAGGELRASLEFSRALFDEVTVRRMLESFLHLLRGALAAPERRLAEIPLLAEAQQHQLLREWSGPGDLPAGAVSILPLFERRAAETPDAPALSHEGRRLTYRELDRRANRLAHRLRRLGVGPETPVAVRAERAPELIVAFLGILKAGGAYVPLDSAYPEERRALMLEDSRALPLAPEDLAGLEEGSDAPPPRALSPGHLAYVLYTSGSTGRPKGVLISHGALAGYAEAIRPVYGIGPGDRVLQFCSTSFDTSLEEIVGALTAGAELVLRTDAMLGSVATFLDGCSRQGVTVLSLPTAYWHEIVAKLEAEPPPARPHPLGPPLPSPPLPPGEGEAPAHILTNVRSRDLPLSRSAGGRWERGTEGVRSTELPSPQSSAEALLPPCLRLVILGGERALPERVAAWRRLAPEGPRLLNTYGVTESTIVSTATGLALPSTAEARGEVSIGRAIHGTEVLVLDREMRPGPPGTAGELYLGGALLARGYLGRPDLTAERFVPHPFAPEPGARLYRTGDLARTLPDGALELRGRTDRQIKVRGYRIEIEEIEARLRQHPEIEAAVVLVREEAPGDRQLVAWVVPAAPAGLRAFVRAALPDYMVPGAFVALAALPLTPNGKVDRRALPAPSPDNPPGPGAGQAPSDPLEELLAGIWSEVLGLATVGVHDDFFALGGHSLRAAQVVSRIRSVLQAEIPLRQLFASPTVAELARAVRDARAGGLPPVEREPRHGHLPLSFSQQRLWVLDRLAPGSPAYNIPSAVRLTGALSPALLERIFAEVVRRHEALRTTFGERDGRPSQVIAPPHPVQIPLLDLTGLPEAEREARARAVAAEEARRPFDLRRGPLLRLFLVRLGAREHLLLLNLHHIIADGWSLGVLLREIAALHEAFSQGRPSPLPELPVQYADFAVWQWRWLDGEVLEAQLASARQRLAGAPHVLELPTDRPRPAVQSDRGATRSFALPPALSAALRTLCRREGATPFMVLLAAWAVLLARHADQDDLLIGSPVAGRNRREIEDLIGFFVNTLVFRIQPADGGRGAGGEGFRELLGQVRGEALEAFSQQDLPFERLVDELAVERSLASAPLVQVMLTLQNAPAGELRLPGLTLAPVEEPGTTAKFDLSLALSETAEGFAGALEYAADLFEPATAERLLGHFVNLLASAAEDPGRPLSELRLMDAAEERLLLVDLNRAERTWALPVTVHELFSRQAEEAPGRTAAVGPQGAMTYRELDERSTALAVSLGPGPLDRRIALFADPDPQVLAGMLGILKAGGGFVPLDPRQPDERLAWILEDCACEALVTQQRHLARAAALAPGRRVLCLDEGEDGEIAAPREPRALAYVIYTSGSTGRPKGVQISHESLVPMLLWGCGSFGLGEPTRVLQSLSFCFDFGVFELLTTLLAGGTLFFPGEAAGDPAAFAREIARHGINTLHTTPAFARELAASGRLDSLEILHLGGEALPPDTVARLREAAPRAAIYNGYGPTEATINSAIFRIKASSQADWPTIPIGRRSADNALYILDRAGRPVPWGARGELYVGGIGVARGYLNRPDLTAERFVPDPFQHRTDPCGARLYRTGDLVRYLPGGDIEFLGRIDQQVKVRGFRIEPGEIETVLRSHPAVRDGVVAVRKDILAAYVVGDGVDAEALRSFLGQRLPDYMVPSAFVVLDALPLSPNGKVDRKALPAPARAAVPESAPADPVEELLAGIWAEVLGLDRVGLHESFFTLGGHSLLATQVISRLRGALGVELPLRQIFETPTVADLARVVRQAGGAPAAPPVLPVPREGDLPLSFAQQRLWLLDRIEPGNPAYNIPLALRLRGALSPGLLERVFAEIVRRHEALRTTFAARDEGPVQRIAADGKTRLPLVDLSALPEDRREATARALAREETLRPFDLQSGPLLRLTLVRLADPEHLLLLTLHHIVADGWSMGVLLREIAALHAAFSQGRPSPLPELPLHYADFAIWQRSWLQGEALESQLAFWKRQLSGAPAALELPTDRPRPAIQSHRGAAQLLELPPELSAAVRTLCRREGATLFMTLLAAWALLLGRHADQDDLLIGTPVAGRTRKEIEDLIGFFVNTLVLRIDLSAGGEGFRALLTRVRRTALEAFAHQDLPFERLVEEVAAERDLSRPPLFQVMLTLQNAPAPELSLPGLSLSLLPVESGLAKFDLTLGVQESGGGIAALLEHNTDLFDAATAARLLARLAALLEAAAGDPDRPLAGLPLLLPAERFQTLVEENDTAVPVPEVCLHTWIAAQAARTPDAVAVTAAGEALTYRELVRRAHQLSHHLIGLGAAPEERVGILLERSPGLLVGLLGILGAGAAYVPLDPAAPPERLAALLESAGISRVLTRERLAGRLPGRGEWAVRLDMEQDEIGRQPDTPPAVRTGADRLAYVLFTSGSTGAPKGVMVEHRSVVNYLAWCLGAYGLAAGRRSLVHSPLGFDLTVTSLFAPLLAGGEVRLLPEGPGIDELSRALREDGDIHLLKLTPAHLEALGRDLEPEAARRVGVLVVGGEALSGHALAPWRTAAPGTLVVNEYGPTEATVGCSVLAFPAAEAGAGRVPIGRAIANAQLYVLDRDLHPLPPGARGELGIGGGVLARGYLGRPDLTAERFVPDPFAEIPGARLYRTGDLVVRRADGTLDFLGRNDHQVKVRGFRIEPGEIEAALASHPAVRECVAVARNGLLAAYVVPDPADRSDPSDLKSTFAAWLRERLPEYMVPSVFVLLDALPLSPNGKVDRKALPAPERTGGPEHLGPRDALELRLVQIWEEVLGVRPIGVRDDFFSLGGHSLLAVQVTARLQSRLGRSLPLASLLRHSTVERLAALLREETGPVTGQSHRAPLVELAAGPGRPLFLIHPVGGEVLCYVPLARRLGRPIFGLQAGLQAPEEALSLEAMAGLYLRHIREIQPEGPYLLGGWSLGGAVAFEMARQLEPQGETVERVVLIDSFAPGDLWREEAGEAELLAAFATDLARLLGIGGIALPEDFGERRRADALGWLAARAEEAGLLPPGLGAGELERRFATFAANHHAMALYPGGPCAAPLLLLRAAEPAWGEPDRGWGRIAGQPVEVHDLPGDHYTLLQEPAVEGLAALLRERLLRYPSPPAFIPPPRPG